LYRKAGALRREVCLDPRQIRNTGHCDCHGVLRRRYRGLHNSD
jgi:hypothetical protein